MRCPQCPHALCELPFTSSDKYRREAVLSVHLRDDLRQWLQARGTTPIIPPRSNCKVQYEYDKMLYRERNIIERSFGLLKDFRRTATRFDRNLRAYMAALCIVAAVVWWL
jgi:transposase